MWGGGGGGGEICFRQSLAKDGVARSHLLQSFHAASNTYMYGGPVGRGYEQRFESKNEYEQRSESKIAYGPRAKLRTV